MNIGENIKRIRTNIKIADVLNVDISEIVNDYYQVGIDGHPELGPVLSASCITTNKMDEVFLINYYRQLNDTGKTEAHKRIGELTLLDIYKTTEKQQSPVIKYNPEISSDISSINFMYESIK